MIHHVSAVVNPMPHAVFLLMRVIWFFFEKPFQEFELGQSSMFDA